MMYMDWICFVFVCLMIDRARAGLKIVGNDGAEGVFGRIETKIGAARGGNGMHFDFFILLHFDFFRDVSGLDMFCFVYLMIDRAHSRLKTGASDGGEGVFGRIGSKIGAEPGGNGMHFDFFLLHFLF